MLCYVTMTVLRESARPVHKYLYPHDPVVLFATLLIGT